MVDLSLVKPQDLWYTIGLIATDGSLSKNGRHINITSKDKELLDGLKKVLHLNLTLTSKSRKKGTQKKYFCLQIGDIKFYQFLLKIGLCQKKSLTLGPIKVPSKYFGDFFRGIIDGDGSISRWQHNTNRNVQWSLRIFSGSSKFIEWLNTKSESVFHLKGKLYKDIRKENNILYTLKFGKFAAKKMLSQVYYEGSLSLQRKNIQALLCLKAEDKLSKYGKYTSPGGGTGIRY